MSTKSDLASWGEPPATPAEEALGTLIDKVITKIERGQPVTPESLRGDRPELEERDQQLVDTVSMLYECAASVWGHSSLKPGGDPNSSHHYSSVGVSGDVPKGPGNGDDNMQVSPTAKNLSLPDPFPGQFRILQVLGEGAFGKVLLAEDLNLGWQVALKTLKLPATSTLGPHVLSALRKDGQHLAQLDHPNIVRVHAWLEAGGEYYLVMQYVAGGSLGARLKKVKALNWQDAARYVADVGEALVEAHKRGVIHRDIKPDNILWDQARDEAMLTDFGVSARLAEQGTAAGTLMYMAPEAFEGHVSPALDVYSLAATFYRLVTGKLPFAKAPVPSLVYQKLQGLPDPDPRCKGIPEPLEQIIRAGLAGRPELRPTMGDFVARLRGSLNQLLADALASDAIEGTTQDHTNVQLVVSRRVQGDLYQPVATTKPGLGSFSRDMKKVPRAPETVNLRTGDRVRIDVITDREGYVTVFNIGPTGNLNRLYPDELSSGVTVPLVNANRPLKIVDVEMEPPTGRERLFAVWSLDALSLQFDKLISLAEAGDLSGSRPYRATRDMKRVKQSAERLPRESWHAVVLELDHRQ